VLHLPIAASAETQHGLHPVIEQAVLLAASATAREEAAMQQRAGDAERRPTRCNAPARAARSASTLAGGHAAELHEQVADLSVLAERYAALEFSEQDAKYQMQRSYNARRGKRRYDATLARGESPEG
jgi:Ca-activated chloride channel homolog